MSETAITPTRKDNYPEWYQQVIKAADLAENSVVRGCMVIKPWGYGIWENIQQKLDRRIKATGHENAYFPIFIPLSFLEKEAAHVEGFAKECAVVTHHRLETKDGKLVPAGELEEPYIVRPTSETIIGESFSRWIQSYRDLPLLINQWANVVRWEMRTRLFLRTAEFLWQEGHTAHASSADALAETLKIAEMYREFVETELALPVYLGEKSESERFPGAEATYTIEAIMQDGKALQAGTSHYLGQNFAKASNIKFLNEAGSLEHAFTTSWGVSTRLIGGLIMAHADDDGMRVPPRVAAQQVVVLPVVPKPELNEQVQAYADEVVKTVSELVYAQEAVRVKKDARDIRGGDKNWQWIKKGIPLRIEVGPKDLAERKVVLCRRDKGVKEKEFLSLDDLKTRIPVILAEIQQNYFNQAKAIQTAKVRSDLVSFEQFKEYFSVNDQSLDLGFVIAPWCEDLSSESLLTDLKVTIRCLPFDQPKHSGKCILTGKPAKRVALFAKAY